MPKPNQSVFSQGDNGSGNASGGDPVPSQSRNAALYPYNDPQQAMMNVLMDRGYNPFKTNPFIGDILNAAPGLSTLWQLSNMGSNATDIGNQGGPDAMFHQFLLNQLSGGSMFGNLNQGMANFPNYLSQLRSIQDKAQGMDPTQLPPFLASLESQLNSPKGFGSLYGSMASPVLGDPLGQSFQRSLSKGLMSGWRNFLQPNVTPDIENPPNFFDFILGRR